MTLEQVGAALGVTRERVRQIEAQALEKLNTGRGDADIVTVDGLTVALAICDRCDLYFPRQGRQKTCPGCLNPQVPAKEPRRGREPRAITFVSLRESTRVDIVIAVIPGGLDDVLAMMFD